MSSETDTTPVLMDIDPVFDPDALGWKEIGNLASWTVSTCKPGCGVEALRDEDTSLFWQYVVYPLFKFLWFPLSMAKQYFTDPTVPNHTISTSTSRGSSP